MPPARKAIALLLTHPELAASEADHDGWLSCEDSDIQILGRLLKLLHERSHYNLSHILGYWLGVYGTENTEKLATIASHDLLQATNAITQVRQDKPPKADYDATTAFCGCMEKLRKQENAKKTAQLMEKLRNGDLTQEERKHLATEVLAHKIIK